jgi:hypothetical protein
VITVAVRMRNRPQFETDRDAPALSTAGGTTIDPIELHPTSVAVTLTDGGGGPDVMTIETLTNTDVNGYPNQVQTELIAMSSAEAARDGAYVIISDDRVPDDTATPFKNEMGQANGRVYRLSGRHESVANGWYLSPEMDMGSGGENLPVGGSSNKAIAFLIGAGYSDPLDPTTGFSGPNRAVQVFQNIVSLKD